MSLAQHERIVAAITAGDPREAEAAMLDHISSVIEALNGLPGEPAGQARIRIAEPGSGTRR